MSRARTILEAESARDKIKRFSQAARRARRPVSAEVAQPNTPASDLMPEVMHIVTFDDGSTMRLMAADPPDAIKKAYAQK